MDKESKLLKIQVYADSVHTHYNVSFSYLLSFLITGLFVILTISYEHLIPSETGAEFMILIAAICISEIYFSGRRYRKRIKEIFEDIDALTDFNDPSIGDDM